VLPEARLEVTLPEGFGRVAAYSPDDQLRAELDAVDGERYRLRLENVPLYGILRLSR
jgi:hypothetical protein